VVPIDEAVGVFTAGRHPGSFVALDGVDHAITDDRQARNVAALIATWAEPYLPDLLPDQATDEVVVTEAGTGRYAQRITAGHHVFTADEPASIGGDDTGPNPYDLLLAALGACTSMTLRMYADREALPLQRTTVRLRHDHVHAQDCANVGHNAGTIIRIVRELDLEGPLTAEHRRRLVEIADRCPVHRTISSQIAFETTTT
jgi:putative redox protein